MKRRTLLSSSIAVATAAPFGPSTTTLMGLIMLFLIPAYARLVRSSTLAAKGADYVLALRPMGASSRRILGIHVLPEARMRDYRGAKVSMVFQDPMTALSPARSIGGHLMDAQHRDRNLGRAELRERAIAVLRKVGVPDPEAQLDRHPHQLSGGMRQRVAIAMALLGRPELLIADEITTALDVTLEAQILHLLRDLRSEIDGAILFISHNLGAVAEICDHVAVFYAGELVEDGPVREIFHSPRHPYTRALRDCDPARIKTATRVLPSIPGETPVMRALPTACVFAPRCAQATELCRSRLPDWTRLADGRGMRCHFAERGA